VNTPAGSALPSTNLYVNIVLRKLHGNLFISFGLPHNRRGVHDVLAAALS
jgi:hypothetical protein